MKSLKNSRGVAIIYVTLFLMVFGLLFVALGVDVGWLAYVRSRGQAMVDASALSGAAALPSYNPAGNTDRVFEMAKAFNSDNTVVNGDTGIQTSTNSSTNVQFCSGSATSPTCVPAESVTDTKKVGGVKITRTFQAPLFFGKLFNGGSTTDITVSSIAWLDGPVSACKAGQDPPCINVALRECQLRNPTGTLACGTNGVLFQSPDSGADTSAFTTFSERGNDDCKRMASNPAIIPTANSGETINLVGSGQAASCLSDLKSTFDRLGGSDGCPAGVLKCWHVVVPVIACEDTSASSAELRGFASFTITDITSSGSPKTISGSLTCPASLPESRGTGENFGTYATRAVLVK